MTSKRLDVVTVVFSDDLHLLKLQARSIGKFVDPDLVGTIHIVINDTATDFIRRCFDEHILHEYGPLASKVCFMNHDIRWTATVPGAGWFSQQVLKLAAARHVTAPQYLVLDAKNHFVRRLDARAVFASDGRLQSHRPYMAPRFLPQYEHCLRYFGASALIANEPALPTTTPFLMITDLAKGLVAHVEAREERPFQDYFWDHRREISEFCLYGAYVEGVAGGFDRHYTARRKPTATLYRTGAEDPGKCRRTFARLRLRDVYCMGVHPHVIRSGNREVLDMVWKNWRRFGLVYDEEDAALFLGLQPPFKRRRFFGLLAG